MESLLLSVAHHWSLRETADRQVELVERHFRQDEMLSSMRKLAEVVGPTCPKVNPRRGGSGKTATRSQAEDLVNTLKKLGDLAKLPRLLVQSDDLPRILPLLGAVSVGDERGVAARLEALEVSHQQGMKEVRRMVEAVARSALQPATRPPGVVVTDPLAAARPEVVVTAPLTLAVSEDRAAVAAPQTRSGWPVLPVPGATVGSQASFFDTRPPARGAGRRHLVPGQQAESRERSQSAKRTRTGEDGEYRVQGRPRAARNQRTRAKGATGTGPELEGLEDLTGPVEWYIGNTHPNQTEEKISDTLSRYAEYHKVTNFVVEKVTSLTKEPNPRNKSWKVVVPARLKEVMEKPEMFPKGWINRAFTFYSGPRRQERVGQERKEQRPGSGPAQGAVGVEQPRQEQQGEVVMATEGEVEVQMA